MIAYAFLVGIGLPTLNGWLLLGLLQKHTRILLGVERVAAGGVIGLALSMGVVFYIHTLSGVPLSQYGFLGIQLGMLGILSLIAYKFYSKFTLLKRDESKIEQPKKVIRYLLYTLVTWVVLKALSTGTVFLFLTPTYLDDSLDNWNLRGKLYFEDQAITLALPGEDPEQSRMTISSYPPTVPLMKAWIASVAGAWSDPAANGIHLFYYIAALLLVASVTRRLVGRGWDLFAVYVLGSLPLYAMHGTNPYADGILSVHVFLAYAFPLCAFVETDPARRMAFLRIGAVCAALLPLLKNEGLLIYLPPLFLIGSIVLFQGLRHRLLLQKDALRIVAWYVGMFIVLTLPWLIFKWSHGLTFGNAKSFTSLSIGWQTGVVESIIVNTFFEGNWLLLFPVLIGLLTWRRRAAWKTWLPLTAYVCIICAGQMMIFLFTGLSVEARMQTGLARAGVQMMPLLCLLTILLLADAAPVLQRSTLELRRSLGMLDA